MAYMRNSPTPILKRRRGHELAIIIVTYGGEAGFSRLLESLVKQKRPGDRIVVVDNHEDHGCAKLAEAAEVVDTVIRSKNVGFAAGCNVGVASVPTTISLLLFLNPDIVPDVNAIEKLREGGNKTWGAWMGLVVLPDGTINSAGNCLHISGLSWCGNYGEASDGRVPAEIKLASGACLMVRSSVWSSVGGLPEDYFMYYEDTDFCMSLWKQGILIGLVPAARFTHDYSFEKGTYKWFYLERNRLVCILRQWPVGILAVLWPLLLVCEIGLFSVSILQRRFWLKVRANSSFIAAIPSILRSRRAMPTSKTSNAEFYTYLDSSLNTPLLGFIGRSKLINALFDLYYHGAKLVIGMLSKLS
jgi:GT2 family glycosyltransferase